MLAPAVAGRRRVHLWPRGGRLMLDVRHARHSDCGAPRGDTADGPALLKKRKIRHTDRNKDRRHSSSLRCSPQLQPSLCRLLRLEGARGENTAANSLSSTPEWLTSSYSLCESSGRLNSPSCANDGALKSPSCANDGVLKSPSLADDGVSKSPSFANDGFLLSVVLPLRRAFRSHPRHVHTPTPRTVLTPPPNSRLSKPRQHGVRRVSRPAADAPAVE